MCIRDRSYLALVTLVMSYFETSDRLVLSVFVGSTGLIVFFWFLTKSVATAKAVWIAALVLYVVAVLYLIPTIRGTVVTIEDVDKISALFDAATHRPLQKLLNETLHKSQLRNITRKKLRVDECRAPRAVAGWSETGSRWWCPATTSA